MAKVTEAKKQIRLDKERLVRFSDNLLQWLMREGALDRLGLDKREQDALLMFWKYNLTIEQIAAKFSVSKERGRQILDKALTKIYVRISRMINEYPLKEELHKENQRLKQENERYRAMFNAASPEKKEQLKKNDIGNKKIEDLQFSVRTANTLRMAGIRTIHDLLKSDASELFALKGFGVRTMVEIEKLLRGYGLAIKR